MDIFNKAVSAGIFRQVMQAVGMVGVTGGLYTAEQNAVIAGALASIVAVVLEIVDARNKRAQIKELENK